MAKKTPTTLGTVLEVLKFLKQSHSGLVYAVLEQWHGAEMTHGMMKCR